MFTQETMVITDIALQPLMKKSFVLHKRAERRVHVDIWQHAGLYGKPEVTGLGAGLAVASASARTAAGSDRD